MLLLVVALSKNRPAISSGIRQSLEVDLGVGHRFRRRYPVMAGVDLQIALQAPQCVTRTLMRRPTNALHACFESQPKEPEIFEIVGYCFWIGWNGERRTRIQKYSSRISPIRSPALRANIESLVRCRI